MKEQLIRVSEYARKNKKSLAWAYKQIQQGKVEFREIAKMKFIVVKFKSK